MTNTTEISGAGPVLKDPCAEFGPAQRLAFVWFALVLILGTFATVQFAQIDSWMYANNAEFLDMEKYRENRFAFTSVGSDRLDPRSRGDYFTAVSQTK